MGLGHILGNCVGLLGGVRVCGGGRVCVMVICGGLFGNWIFVVIYACGWVRKTNGVCVTLGNAASVVCDL